MISLAGGEWAARKGSGGVLLFYADGADEGADGADQGRRFMLMPGSRGLRSMLMPGVHLCRCLRGGEGAYLLG